MGAGDFSEPPGRQQLRVGRVGVKAKGKSGARKLLRCKGEEASTDSA